MHEEMKYPYLPGLLLSADPVNAGAQRAENIELPKIGELNKRGGFRRVNHRHYTGAIVCIPDLQRICDYRKLLVCSGYPELPGIPAPIFEHDERGGGGGGTEPFWDENYPPIAVASATPASDLDPLQVQFSSAGSYDPDGTIVGYLWTFGDGGSSTEENPQYTYAAAGNYTATLTVTDNEGKTGTDTVPVTTDPWVLEAQIPNDIRGMGFLEIGGVLYVGLNDFTAADTHLYQRNAGVWNFVASAGTFSSDFRPSIVNDGGVLLLEMNLGVSRLQAGALVADLVGLNADGNLITAGGVVHTNGRLAASGQYTYKRTGPGVWAYTGPNADNVNLFHDQLFDNVVVGFSGRYSNASPPVFTAQATPLPGISRSGFSEYGGQLYAGCTGGVLRKATAAGAWANAGAPAAQYLDSAVVGGILWIGQTLGGVESIVSYDGATWATDRSFPGETIYAVGATATDLYVITRDAAVPEAKIYRRSI